ncbi:hypothetical protein [Aeromonas phage AS-zj]|uniref:Uncharacterized protein n=1 Tax=Aeromonas phage AS-zj TaxID=2024208 RepID=A0A223LFS9_9CAUD|nr:hypothetical protein HWB28_gp213 [Aeromonas phage AS-zj]ASU00339.1 hypothetical protein [Aeromonas phage AS-zj]
MLLKESEKANKAFKDKRSNENWELLNLAYDVVEEILYSRYPDCFGWRAVVSPFDEDRFLVKIKG